MNNRVDIFTSSTERAVESAEIIGKVFGVKPVVFDCLGSNENYDFTDSNAEEILKLVLEAKKDLIIVIRHGSCYFDKNEGVHRLNREGKEQMYNLARSPSFFFKGKSALILVTHMEQTYALPNYLETKINGKNTFFKVSIRNGAAWILDFKNGTKICQS